MIDHVTLRVKDIGRTRAFYAAALAPLGYAIGYEAAHEGTKVLGFTKDGHIDTWFIDHTEPLSGPTHLCWRASDRAAVDAFHAAGLAAGGMDNGAPGLRPHYHPHYYGAFLLDPDGNNVEAVCHEPG
jgi:catechol 2,3-dioxygenase-like lactoylglutathione lyase family enzyme